LEAAGSLLIRGNRRTFFMLVLPLRSMTSLSTPMPCRPWALVTPHADEAASLNESPEEVVCFASHDIYTDLAKEPPAIVHEV
jgi:hypothetical protein